MKPFPRELIDLRIPGPVPKESDPMKSYCQCNECEAYRGTFEVDPDNELPDTPEFYQPKEKQ